MLSEAILVADSTTRDLTDVIRAVQQGDLAAYDRIYQATILEMKSWIAYRCSSWDMVEECLQRTYITAHKALPSYQSDRPFLAWLKGIARNEVGKYIREQSRRSKRHLKALWEAQAQRCEEVGPLEDHEELTPRLADCLNRLGESLRTMIWRRYVEEKAVKDIATELGRTSNSLSVALHRAREALRSCLSKEQQEP